ncbi:hypothetical protein NA78x_005337 [Anatilimnocola sp. NA78]|uniref:hypothetical protein n=1 Tax=Anatilimnocola sp. NA78 TaxID=3415683 RepID=UPI003CE4C644
MSQEPINPFASPVAVNEFPQLSDANHRAKLYEIAKAQNFLIMVVLAGLIVGISGQLLPNMIDRRLVWLFVVLQLIVSVFQSVAMFRMGKTVYSMGSAIALAVVSFIPCIGLVCMLIVNSSATKKLTASGIKVGFMGADLKQFDNR